MYSKTGSLQIKKCKLFINPKEENISIYKKCSSSHKRKIKKKEKNKKEI